MPFYSHFFTHYIFSKVIKAKQIEMIHFNDAKPTQKAVSWSSQRN